MTPNDVRELIDYRAQRAKEKNADFLEHGSSRSLSFRVNQSCSKNNVVSGSGRNTSFQ